MTFSQFVYQFSGIINGILALLAALAVLAFFYGLVRMLIAGSSKPEVLKESKVYLVKSLIALFIIFALGSILNFFAQDFFGRSVTSGSFIPSYPTH